ncbi:HDIG domain-containing protein [Parabacteroides sp. OttesenSCG-928-G21]|nr:HDIG domain-containing protein [Parabacteroides sp. OttesenSCG-928-G21]
MDPYELITKYYPINSDIYRLLVTHSRNVADKALAIARNHPEMNLDLSFIEEAAMLHDIGIFLCNAPGIGCYGDMPYICHGYLGADLLRKEGYVRHALVCERHTGTGITRQMIEEQNLPLPDRNFVPETLEEQIICFADKFFSKTKPFQEKSVTKVKKGLSKYGKETVERFDEWRKRFLKE